MKVLMIPNQKEDIFVLQANSFFTRLRGLIGRILDESAGLLLTPCNQVHTFFMRYSIDVVFLSASNRVLHIEEDMKPYKIGKKVKKATRVLELKSGSSRLFQIKVGDTLQFRETKTVQ